jgi:hypothetical protein
MLPKLKVGSQDSGRTSERNVFITQAKTYLPAEMSRSKSVVSQTVDSKAQMEKDVEFYIKSLNLVMK